MQISQLLPAKVSQRLEGINIKQAARDAMQWEASENAARPSAGATNGDNSMIGDRSVVTGNIPENAAGNRCRVLQPLTSEEQQQ